MDVLYEESAVNANAAKGEKRYKILNLFTWFFGVLALIFAILFVIGLVSFLMAMSAMKAEDRAAAIGSLIFYFMMITLFGGPWLACFLMKRKINVSFDYTFVSGELRISKVFNVNRRKFLYRIDAAGRSAIRGSPIANIARLRTCAIIKRRKKNGRRKEIKHNLPRKRKNT